MYDKYTDISIYLSYKNIMVKTLQELSNTSIKKAHMTDLKEKEIIVIQLTVIIQIIMILMIISHFKMEKNLIRKLKRKYK